VISISLKPDTLRIAKAEGWLKADPETLRRLNANDLPKPDALASAKVAGLMAAKKTAEILPYCHPILLDHVSVQETVAADGVRFECQVTTVGKTGVEMEALTGVSAACLALYDVLKAVDGHQLEITGVKLLEKEGGKSDFKPHLKPGYRAEVLVVSDRVSKGQAVDKTGPYLVELLASYGVEKPGYQVLPDEPEQVKALMLKLCESGADLIISTGGTGLSPRDRTVEAAKAVIERELPGAMEAARAFGQRRTPYAMLSRGVAGVRGKTMIVTLPGSMGGVKESMAAIYPYLFHAHHVMGSGHA
jgi:molybdenum cofactor biosynthesis protein MoaC